MSTAPSRIAGGGSSAAEIAALDEEVYSLLRSPGRHAAELIEYVRDMIPEDVVADRLVSIGAPVIRGASRQLGLLAAQYGPLRDRFPGNNPRFCYYFLKEFDFRRFNSGELRIPDAEGLVEAA